MLIKKHDKTAIIAGNEKISYSELLRRINGYSSLISKRGIRAAVIMENRPEWVYSFYAIAASGNTAVTVDYLSSEDEISYILNDCRSEIVFCSNETEEKIRSACKSFPVTIVNVDGIRLNFQNFPDREIEDLPNDFEFILIYTSGTTGRQKGVILTYDNLIANVESVSGEVPIYVPDDRVMVLLPLHHCFPLAGTLIGPIYIGATIVFSPSIRGEDIMNTLQSHRVTLLLGVPRLYRQIIVSIRLKIRSRIFPRAAFFICSLLGSKFLSRKIFAEVHAKFGGSIRYLVSGGAALDISIAKDLRTLGFDVLEGYGMTEAAPMITCTKPGAIKPGSVGTRISNTEIAIVDGEICCRGRNVMKGYFNRPQETAEMLRGGWLHTGDLGRIDSDGMVYITGRKKEIIVLSNGKNINPEEVEEKFSSVSPYVIECAVYADGDLLRCLILPDIAAMNAASIHNISEYVKLEIVGVYNSQSPSYKKISGFDLIDRELPRTRLGKIQRFRLADLVADRSAALPAEADPDDEEFAAIKDFLLKSGKTNVRPSSHFELDLGLDSLDKVSLFSFIQTRFGIVLDDGVFSGNCSPSMLAEYIKQNATGRRLDEESWSELLNTDSKDPLPVSAFPHVTIRNFLKVLAVTVFRARRFGVENIPDSPCLIVPNHQSVLDWMIIASALKVNVLRRTVIFAKKKHFRSPFRRFLASRSNIVLIDINNDLKDAIHKMGQVLRSGHNLAIFPEGTRCKDGRLGEFKKTFAILSKELNIPVVPVVIKGSFRAWPYGRKFFRPFTRIDVEFLPALRCGADDYEAFAEKVRSEINTRLSMTPEAK